MLRHQRMAIHKTVLHDQITTLRDETRIRLELSRNMLGIMRRIQNHHRPMAVDQTRHRINNTLVDSRPMQKIDPAPQRRPRRLPNIVTHINRHDPTIRHMLEQHRPHQRRPTPKRPTLNNPLRARLTNDLLRNPRVERMLQRRHTKELLPIQGRDVMRPQGCELCDDPFALRVLSRRQPTPIDRRSRQPITPGQPASTILEPTTFALATSSLYTGLSPAAPIWA